MTRERAGVREAEQRMEPASVLRVLSACRVVVGLPTGAVVCALLASPVDADTYAASPLQPVHGWVSLGPYDLEERAFRGSAFQPDRNELAPAVTTAYQRIHPLWG